MPTREDAWTLLCEWTQSENLRRHGLAVEAAVAWYGEHRFGVGGADLERWRRPGSSTTSTTSASRTATRRGRRGAAPPGLPG